MASGKPSAAAREVADIGRMCALPHHELGLVTGLHEHFRELKHVLDGKEEVPARLVPHIELLHAQVLDFYKGLKEIPEEVQRACLFPVGETLDGHRRNYFTAAADGSREEMTSTHAKLVKMIRRGDEFIGTHAPPRNLTFPYAAPGWMEVEDFPRRPD